MSLRHYITDPVPADLVWRHVTDYCDAEGIKLRKRDVYEMIPTSYMQYHCEKRGWNYAFVTLLGGVLSDWYYSDQYRHGWQIAGNTPVVYAMRDHSVTGFLNWVANYPEIESQAFFVEAVTHYRDLIAMDREKFETPIEPTYPKPTLPEPEPTPAPIDAPAPGKSSSWKGTVHTIATVLLGLWFVIDMFLPLPGAVKALVKMILEQLAQI